VQHPPPSSSAARLQADRVGLVYDTSRGRLEALRDVDLAVGAGQFVAVLGPSGCGKSSLLRLAAGLMSPTSGRMLINGMPVAGPRPDIGIVFQQPTLLPWWSVLDNVLVPIRAMGGDVAAARPRARDLLALVGLASFARHYPHELSGGMQQRVGIARALVHDPTLLLMDEPFAALDAMTRETMMEEIQRIWLRTQAGTSAKSVLFITHSIPEAVFLADEVLVMSPRPGRIIERLPILLPRPRDLAVMDQPEFVAHTGHLRSLFRGLAS
jgi:NitT/TauT family transport system ATP-binding protein